MSMLPQIADCTLDELLGNGINCHFLKGLVGNRRCFSDHDKALIDLFCYLRDFDRISYYQ